MLNKETNKNQILKISSLKKTNKNQNSSSKLNFILKLIEKKVHSKRHPNITFRLVEN